MVERSFANGNGAGGFEYDTNTGRPDPEMQAAHWWFAP